MSSNNRLIQPSSMKEALNKPQKIAENSIVMKGKIDRTKVDYPAIQSSLNKVENSVSQLSLQTSSKVKKGAPHRQAIAVAASIDIDSNNKEIGKDIVTGDDYETSKISKNKKKVKQEELESVMNLSKWGAEIGADNLDDLDDW